MAADEGVEVDDVLVADASAHDDAERLRLRLRRHPPRRRLRHLLAELSPAEARVVVAHELAHAKHDDVLVGRARCRGRRPRGHRAGAAARHRPAPPPRRHLGPRGPGVGRGGPRPGRPRRPAGRPRPERDQPGHRGPRGPGGAGGDESTTFVDMQRELSLRALSDPTRRPGASCGSAATPPCCSERASPRRWKERDEQGPRRHQRLPDANRGIETFVMSLCERMDPDRSWCTPPRCRATWSDATPVPGLPGPRLDAAAHAGRGAAGGRGDAAARLRPGAGRQRAAGAARPAAAAPAPGGSSR